MFDSQFAKILRCLETGSELELIDDALLQRVNQAVQVGQLSNRLDEPVGRLLSSGLVNADRTLLYAVYDGIPQMLAGEAIPLTQLNQS